MSRVRLPLAGCMLAFTLAACSFERPVSEVPTSYDFGPPPAYSRANPPIAGIVLIAPVSAAAPLDDTGIVYRQLHQDATRPEVYAMSRWSDEPARLITERLRARFASIATGVVSPAFSARSDYTLRVDLVDFSQYFDAPGQSRVQLRARATLLSSENRRLLAQRAFEIDRPSAPNAPGAVKALTEAADAFIEDLAKWAVESAPAAAKGKP